MDRKVQLNTKRKLSYYFSALQAKESPITVDVLDSPNKHNASSNKVSRLSFGCSRDSDWKRRMDGFSGLEIGDKDATPAKSSTSTKKRVVEIDDKQISPETQQDIEEWQSSDSDDCTKIISKYAVRKRSHSAGHSKPMILKQHPSITNVVDAVDIADGDSYNSEKEDQVDYNVSEESMSPVISVGRSQSPESETVAAKTSKASDWVKDICWNHNTPTKVVDKQQALEDSSKKKHQKYIKDGLAENLHRLIQQHRSLLTFRTHKFKRAATTKDTDVSRAVTVKINHVETGPSLITATCTVLTEPEDSTTLSMSVPLFVMFTQSMWTHHKLTDHATVRIYPPWQILKQPSGSRVLLCTSHLDVLEQPQNHAIPDQISVPGNMVQLLAQWTCPCCLDHYADKSQCPAHTHPVDMKPLATSSEALPHLQHKPQDDQLTTAPTVMELTTLIQTSSSPSRPSVTHSILEAIETSGGGIIRGLNFVATVQRIFNKDAKNLNSSLTSHSRIEPCCSRKYALLLQDFCGFLCELMLPPGCENKHPWDAMLTSGEGKTYQFKGLRVSHRINRNKSARLFSVIDSVWKASSVVEKPQTSQDSQQMDLPTHAPSFCYILQAPSGDTTCELRTDSSVYSQIIPQPLSDIILKVNSDDTTTRRASFEGRIIFEKDISKLDWTPQKIIYVISAGDECGCLQITVSQSVYSNISSIISHCLLLRDIAISQGHCVLDEYSTVSDKGIPSTLTTPDIVSRLQQLSFPVKPDVLCVVQGVVSGIDEDSAYSWLACDQCGNDNLQGGTATQPFLFCSVCKRGVPQPVNRMNLEIIIRIQELYSHIIKVKLLQNTIQEILPQDSADEEGYDIQSVLGKVVGPIPVMMTTFSDNVFNLQQVTFL